MQTLEEGKKDCKNFAVLFEKCKNIAKYIFSSFAEEQSIKNLGGVLKNEISFQSFFTLIWCYASGRYSTVCLIVFLFFIFTNIETNCLLLKCSSVRQCDWWREKDYKCRIWPADRCLWITRKQKYYRKSTNVSLFKGTL